MSSAHVFFVAAQGKRRLSRLLWMATLWKIIDKWNKFMPVRASKKKLAMRSMASAIPRNICSYYVGPVVCAIFIDDLTWLRGFERSTVVWFGCFLGGMMGDLSCVERDVLPDCGEPALLFVDPKCSL